MKEPAIFSEMIQGFSADRVPSTTAGYDKG
jgi:hypothetical protein